MLHFSEDRMDDLRHEAMAEAALEDLYDQHYMNGHTDGFPQDDCPLCEQDALDAAAEA